MFSLSNLCFLCLNSSTNLKPVLKENNEEILMEKQLKYCLPEMDVDFLTEIPKYICSNCINKLESLYKFKETCLQNNIYLKNYIQTLTSTYGSNKQLSVKLTDIKYQDKLQTMSSCQSLPTIGSDELRTDEKEDNGSFNEDAEPVPKREIMFVDVLDIERSHSFIKEENEVFIKEEFVTSDDNVNDEYVQNIKCETITSDSDISVSRIDDLQENSKYSNSSSENNWTKPQEDQMTLFMHQGRYVDDNAQMATVSSSDECSPTHGKWKNTQDASSVNISREGEGESSTSTWRDEGTALNTSVDLHVRSTTGESLSTICETRKINDISEDILMREKKNTEDLIPTKSKAIYDKEFKIFVNWKLKNDVTVVNETVMMTYFEELSKKYTPNSLWTKYSILKSVLIVNDNVDISPFKRLVPFLKKKLKGYIPKKSKVLTGDQVLMFMKNAPNEKYLLHKVVLVMGVFGGLRRDEMVRMTIDDIQDKGSILLVKIPKSKTATAKSFTIVDEEEIGALNLVRKYAALRPTEIKERRFFLTYSKNRCTRQPVGKNTIGSVPTVIATYLKLDNAKEYTGHCLRRTSSTLLVEAGTTFETLKLNGILKSTQIAKRYVNDCIASKNRVARMIASSMSISGVGKGESSRNIWRDKGTALNTYVDLHVQSTTTSTIGETGKINDISENIFMREKKATEDLIPTKSKAIYDKEFKIFVNWKLKNDVTVVNETVMMTYFEELSKKYTPNSLWTKYSILKSTLSVNDNIDISNFKSLVPFLKKKLKGYIPKKSKVLTGDQVLMFMKNAPNEKYLLHKVVLVMGVFGGLRKVEMVRMTIDDIQDKGSFLLVKVPETKSGTAKGFTIVEEEEIGALKLVRKYAALRPAGISERRFFLTYSKNCCTRQPVGKNTIGSVPTVIATYLKLDNAKEYTGHCLRRTSSTLLIEAGATFETSKMHGKWKSTQIAEEYTGESIDRIGSKGESSTNVWQDERTALNTSTDFHVQSTTESSTVCKTKKSNARSSEVRSDSFPGTFEICNFLLGTDSNK